jgi:hypothetical protein
LLATTETRVLMMLKKNELQGNQVDGEWFVDKASLQLCGKPLPSDIVKKRMWWWVWQRRLRQTLISVAVMTIDRGNVGLADTHVF